MMTRTRFLPAVIFLCISSLAAAPSALAATRTVCRSGCAYTKIQRAINASQFGDTVLVKDGIYLENIDFKGKDITVRSQNGATRTVIDGSALGSVVIIANGESAKAVLDGFTVRNGKALLGGGIKCVSSTPKIRNCVISGNVSSRGYYENPMGGGIYASYASPSISNCIVRGNSIVFAQYGVGAGIYSDANSSLSIRYSSVVDNTVGALVGGSGGGIYSAGDLLVMSSVIGGNQTIGFGGGVYSSGNSAIINSTISGNAAPSAPGGGIYSTGTLTLINSTISGNSIQGSGSPGGDGGGIWSGAPFTMINSIVWGNAHSGYPVPPVDNIVGTGSATYSNIQGGWPGTGNIDIDPLFADPRPPTDAPTSAGNYHLLTGSPSINAGTGEGAPTDDIDGDARPTSAGYDMGSDENGNAVVNGSFEYGENRPAPWAGSHLAAKDVRTNKVFHEGLSSFFMAGSAADKSAYQTLSLSVPAGKSITLSGWSKSSGTLAQGGRYCLEAKVFFEGGTTKSYRASFTKSTHGWQYKTLVITTELPVTKVVVSLRYSRQGGRAWFDDIAVSVD